MAKIIWSVSKATRYKNPKYDSGIWLYVLKCTSCANFIKISDYQFRRPSGGYRKLILRSLRTQGISSFNFSRKLNVDNLRYAFKYKTNTLICLRFRFISTRPQSWHVAKGELRVFRHSLLSRPGSDNTISLWHKLRHMIYKSINLNKL